MPSGVSAALRTPVNHCSARSAAPRAATRPYGDSGCTGTEGAAAPGVQPYNMMGALRIDRADRKEEATEEAGDMEAAGRKRELAGEVVDLVTSVNPAMARGAMPWWGQRTGREGVFGEEPQGKDYTPIRALPAEPAHVAAWLRLDARTPATCLAGFFCGRRRKFCNFASL